MDSFTRVVVRGRRRPTCSYCIYNFEGVFSLYGQIDQGGSEREEPNIYELPQWPSGARGEREETHIYEGLQWLHL